MPGYTIVTHAYPEGIPWYLKHLCTDNLTVTTVYYTHQPEINSNFHFNSIIGYRLANCNTTQKIVGLSVGTNTPPDWLTKENNSTVCYVKRHIYDSLHGKVYDIFPTLHRTREEAELFNLQPCYLKTHHGCIENDIVMAYLAHSDIVV